MSASDDEQGSLLGFSWCWDDDDSLSASNSDADLVHRLSSRQRALLVSALRLAAWLGRVPSAGTCTESWMLGFCSWAEAKPSAKRFISCGLSMGILWSGGRLSTNQDTNRLYLISDRQMAALIMVLRCARGLHIGAKLPVHLASWLAGYAEGSEQAPYASRERSSAPVVKPAKLPATAEAELIGTLDADTVIRFKKGASFNCMAVREHDVYRSVDGKLILVPRGALS